MSQQEAVQVQKKRKVGRPPILDAQLQLRLPWSDMYLLSAAAFYEKRDLPEYLRAVFNDLRKKYRRDSSFKEWVDRHKGELEHEGIPVNEIW